MDLSGSIGGKLYGLLVRNDPVILDSSWQGFPYAYTTEEDASRLSRLVDFIRWPSDQIDKVPTDRWEQTWKDFLMITRYVSLPGRRFWGEMDGLLLGRGCFFKIVEIAQAFKNEFARWRRG